MCLMQRRNNDCTIVQVNNTLYQFQSKRVKIYKSLSIKKLINLMRRSDKIISHGGYGTFYMLYKYARHMPLFIARLQSYSEHVDNHQAFFLEKLRKHNPKKLAKYFLVEDEIGKHISEYLNEKSKENTLNNFFFNFTNRKELLRTISKFISKT